MSCIAKNPQSFSDFLWLANITTRMKQLKLEFLVAPILDDHIFNSETLESLTFTMDHHFKVDFGGLVNLKEMRFHRGVVTRLSIETLPLQLVSLTFDKVKFLPKSIQLPPSLTRLTIHCFAKFGYIPIIRNFEHLKYEIEV
ncbi:unnamed protein product [Ambrosiozyma monospora]|uniref:Unnamed protein product n=1 Tax=Ambrosiozyma monospora TaxID=43982 RepID=A0ACB5UAJ7_AMBMO|nr:unnamed protein product [Ambrosiozyma monospora]